MLISMSSAPLWTKRLTLYVRLDVAPMTKKVDRLTKSPKIAETAIATTEAAVYSYLQEAVFSTLLLQEYWGQGEVYNHLVCMVHADKAK